MGETVTVNSLGVESPTEVTPVFATVIRLVPGVIEMPVPATTPKSSKEVGEIPLIVLILMGVQESEMGKVHILESIATQLSGILGPEQTILFTVKVPVDCKLFVIKLEGIQLESKAVIHVFPLIS